MKLNKTLIGSASLVCVAICCVGYAHRLKAADGDASSAVAGNVPLPAIVQNGFKAWAAKQSSTYAFDVWKKGGALDEDRKPGVLSDYFSRVDRSIGNYQSFEVIQSKMVSGNSAIFYVAANFEHAAAYGRFLAYRPAGGKDWLVQNIDFSLKPEAVMPWLAFSGSNDSEQ